MIQRRLIGNAGILALLLAGLMMFNTCTENSSDSGIHTGEGTELQITSISPASGPVGTEVTISGNGFSSVASDNSIMFEGDVTAEVQQASEKELVTKVPEGAESGSIRIEVDGNTAGTAPFEVTPMGVLKIISATSGEDLDEDGYTATLDAGERTEEVAPGDTLIWKDILAGSHDLELSGLADNCSTDGANPRMLEVSPDNTTTTEFSITCTRMRRIAFESDLDIWIMREDGLKLENLTDSPAQDRFYQWSPDGTKIAFQSEVSGNNDIWVMDADGSNLKQLTSHASYEVHLNWSPDGSKIVYTKNNDIWVMNADGSDQTALTTDPGDDVYPAWSPDGTQIAFSSERSDEGEYDLWVMQYDGTGKIRLTSADGYDDVAHWSPDGSRIAFRSMRSGENEIWVINSDGSNETRLHSGVRPRWSPDGSRIVFMNLTSTYHDIWAINPDGTNPVKLTDRMATDSYPKWQPVAQ